MRETKHALRFAHVSLGDDIHELGGQRWLVPGLLFLLRPTMVRG